MEKRRERGGRGEGEERRREKGGRGEGRGGERGEGQGEERERRGGGRGEMRKKQVVVTDCHLLWLMHLSLCSICFTKREGTVC